MLTMEPNIEINVELKNTKLGAFTEVKSHSILEDVIMGDYSYCAGYNQIAYADIGKFCSIASFVRINPGNHPTYDRVAQHHFTYRSDIYGMGEADEAFFQWRKQAAVTIGHDVWIGHNATLMPGVKIGNGAVIGTNSVVTKDVAPYSVVVGIPAKVINKRFKPEMIEKIEALKWWDWDYETLKTRLGDFRDMKTFVETYL